MLLGVEEIVGLSSAGLPIDRQGAESLHREVGGCIATVRMVLSGTDVGSRVGAIQEYLRAKVLPRNLDPDLTESLMRFARPHPGCLATLP